MKKTKTRNPMATALRLFQARRVKPRKGKGSYCRKDNKNVQIL